MSIDTLILDCTQELRLLRMTLSNPELPTADMEAICDRAIYTGRNLDYFQEELKSTAYDLVEQDHLYARVTLTREQKQQLWYAIEQLCMSLKNKLVHLQMYQQGILHYQFGEFLDDDSLVLYKTGPACSRLPDS